MSAPKKSFGGKQPGAGRPKGSLSLRTKAIRSVAADALVSGISPLEVMLEKMRFYHNKADVLLTAILAGYENKKKPLELLEMLKELGTFDDKAFKYAEGAAPFVHARLSATTVDATVTHKVEEAEQAFKVIENSLDAMVTGDIIPQREKAKSKVAV